MKRLHIYLLLAVGVSILCSACATKFTGSAHIDKATCINKCQALGMQLSGMVVMGEYSDACVCKNTSGTALIDSDDGALLSSAATAGSAAGVIMQTQRAAQKKKR